MNLIASILHLDRRAVKMLRITDPYSLHRVVYSLYEDIRDKTEKQSSQPSGILYADQGGDYHGRKILMLANRKPLDSVNGQYGKVQSKSVPLEFLSAPAYRFKVIVNPTRRDGNSRKLISIRSRDGIANWFLERAVSSWGFEVNPQSLQVDKIDVLQFQDKHQRKITIGQAHVQGVLQVVSKEKFIESFTKGIGRGRAFGCGLLQIVPIIENPLQ